MKKLLQISLIVYFMTNSFNLFACKTCGCSAKLEKSLSKTIITNSDFDESTSFVKWIGKKVTGQHEGLVMIDDAFLEFEDNNLVGGQISVKMNTISCTDLDGDSKKSIEGHLKSDDFFSTNKYPFSKLVIKNVKKLNSTKHKIFAKMTVKGITKDINFIAYINNGNAKADIIIDRTKFNVKYGSGSFFENLGDKMIYDDFTLSVNLNY